MSGGRLTPGVGTGLLGIEIGRSRVRLVVLDPEAKTLDDVVERAITKGSGPRDPMEEEASTRAAVESGLERLGLASTVPLMVGVTIGFPHCGVGSGPALRDWLAELSSELGEPLVHVGEHGVSYAPTHCVEFARRLFEPLGLHLDRIELAPVAAARMLPSILRSGAVTLGSGVSWSARILEREVLEAFEVDGAFDEVLHVVANGTIEPIEQLEGVYVDEALCRNRGVTLASLAPAVGVAVALPEAPRSNLLDGTLIGGPVARISGPVPRVESRWAPEPSLPHPARPVSGPTWTPTEQGPPVHRVAEHPADDGWLVSGGSTAPDRSYDDDATYRLRRQAEAASEANPVPAPAHRPRSGALGRRDDLAGIESFSPQPTALDSGFHVSDFVLGALLMLTVVLLMALVLL